MPATARQLDVTQEMLDKAAEGNKGGGAYAEFDCPAEAVGVLKDVEDYDNRKQDGTGTHGWIFYYDVETPVSKKTVPFKTWIAFTKSSRWKFIQIMEAHEVELEAGVNSIDPNALIGDAVGLTIDFPRDWNDKDPETGLGKVTGDFREIAEVFALAEAPDEETPVSAEEPEVL